MGQNILTVYADSKIEHSDHVTVRVYWMTGKRRRKAIDVDLPLTCQDRLAAAEVVASRYLLGEANIFNVNRTGNYLTIPLPKGCTHLVKKNK